MSVIDRSPPVLIGCDELAARVTDWSRDTVILLLDAGIADAAIAVRVRREIERAGRRAETLTLCGPPDLADVIELSERLTGTELVVAVGGGSLLDRAKLAVLLACEPTARARLTVSERSGLVALPQVDRAGRLIAVPTTVGTGAELSRAACLTYPRGKRLVLGDVLRPDAALLDPEAFATLPGEMIAEGVLEALFRTVTVYAGDHTDSLVEDALAESVAENLVALGYRVRDSRAAGLPVDGATLTDIAKLSGLSQLDWLHQGRGAFVAKGWFIANELSMELRVRKMRAVAALLPHLWRAITDGDERFGSARRLSRIWSRLRTAAPDHLAADPAEGIATLIDVWRVDRRITAGQDRLRATASRIVRAWGGGLPMLGGLRHDELRGLLSRAVLPTAAGEAARST